VECIRATDWEAVRNDLGLTEINEGSIEINLRSTTESNMSKRLERSVLFY